MTKEGDVEAPVDLHKVASSSIPVYFRLVGKDEDPRSGLGDHFEAPPPNCTGLQGTYTELYLRRARGRHGVYDTVVGVDGLAADHTGHSWSAAHMALWHQAIDECTRGRQGAERRGNPREQSRPPDRPEAAVSSTADQPRQGVRRSSDTRSSSDLANQHNLLIKCSA